MLRGERPSGGSRQAAAGTIWVDFLRRSCKVSPVSDEAWPRLTRGANAFWRLATMAGSALQARPGKRPRPLILKHQSEPVGP